MLRVLYLYIVLLLSCIVINWKPMQLCAQSLDQEQEMPVIVELFTSHGCSSCPPADKLLSELGFQSEWKEKIIPLAFHIDYWNNNGWKDPFSQKEWTYRQMRYSRAFFTKDYIYTPQMVVQGTGQCLGSSKPKATAQIRHALRLDPAARVKISCDAIDDDSITITVSADLLKKSTSDELWGLVAFYQNDLETHVLKGENKGRNLHNDFVVRLLYKAFSIDPLETAHGQKKGAIEIDPSWEFTDGGIAAWIQDPSTMRIYGAASMPVSVTKTFESKIVENL